LPLANHSGIQGKPKFKPKTVPIPKKTAKSSILPSFSQILPWKFLPSPHPPGEGRRASQAPGAGFFPRGLRALGCCGHFHEPGRCRFWGSMRSLTINNGVSLTKNEDLVGDIMGFNPPSLKRGELNEDITGYDLGFSN